MERSNGARLFFFLTGLVVVLGAVTLAKGGLFINRHEGDTLHLTEILLRMGQGQWPHLDFVTPLRQALVSASRSFWPRWRWQPH